MLPGKLIRLRDTPYRQVYGLILVQNISSYLRPRPNYQHSTPGLMAGPALCYQSVQHQHKIKLQAMEITINNLSRIAINDFDCTLHLESIQMSQFRRNCKLIQYSLN